MEVSPLLDAELVEHVQHLLEIEDEVMIYSCLRELPLESAVHTLRFFVYRGFLEERHAALIQQIWKNLLPESHSLDSNMRRRTLLSLSNGWDSSLVDTFSMDVAHLEKQLHEMGNRSDGRDYFQWIALHPMTMLHGIRDDYRKGAIICMCRYIPFNEIELTIARHLDDWVIIQSEVIGFLELYRSRLLRKVTSWYIANDPIARTFLTS